MADEPPEGEEPMTKEEITLDRRLTTLASAIVDYCKDDEGLTPGETIAALCMAIAIAADRSHHTLTDEKLATMAQSIKEYHEILAMARAAESKVH